MRKLLISVAVLGLVAPSSTALAAEPQARIALFKARAVPIPKPGGGSYAHTGNCLGCGAAVEAEYLIEGSGYGATTQNPNGGIPPISQVNFYLPGGARLHPQGFGTCSEAALKNFGPSACPRSSVASPVGSVLGEVTFGTERVPEQAELRAFFAPHGGLLFFTAGHSPVALEIISSGHYVNSHQRPYGLELITLVPPVASVPGAPLASVRKIKVKAGAAIRKGRSIVSYGYMPSKCPKGGFPVKTEIIFGGSFGPGREFGIPEQIQTATYRAPCPRRH
ncbi:MAG TPA: hypothetical protein VNZ05_05695 [Solirubrobacteraceae bacterium]|jgi:hypothetical protein|nr:hypothetical protein [Solirubrobacteraceae bacterium]